MSQFALGSKSNDRLTYLANTSPFNTQATMPSTTKENLPPLSTSYTQLPPPHISVSATKPQYPGLAPMNPFASASLNHSGYLAPGYIEKRSLTPMNLKTVTLSLSKTNSVQQDFFLSELTNEVNDLRSKQKDFKALQEQYKYLQEQWRSLNEEKRQFEFDCLQKIQHDRQEVDLLNRELDQLRAQNLQVEDEQMRLIEAICVNERDIAQTNYDMAEFRNQCSQNDVDNLGLRKEIDQAEVLVNQERNINSKNHEELQKLQGVMYSLERDLESQRKRVDILQSEIANNDSRIKSSTDLANTRDEAIASIHQKIAEGSQQINDMRYTLNKLDGELGYFEHQNESHKDAQNKLFQASEYEYNLGKDTSSKIQEYEITFNKLIQDEQQLSFEIDRLKQHSDQMLKDQIELQAEIDALDKHMSSLNNQNYCLQKELEEFIEADDQVRRNLDRKNRVDNIRQRVDEVIARSQAEVEHQRQIIYTRDPSPLDFKRIDRYERTIDYSPPQDPYQGRRTAWTEATEEDVMKNQMSFGREKYERQARFSYEKENRENEYRQKSGSPLREINRSQSFIKKDQIAK